jgi:hypothetical protein
MAWQDSDISGGKVRLKHSPTAAETIAADGLVPGEVAINTADGKLYYKSASGVLSIPGDVPVIHASTHQTGGADAIAPVVASPTQITANVDNYALGTGDIFRLSANAARDITGFVAGTSGQAVLLVNVGSHAITIKHQSASSSAANRVVVPWAGDFNLDANGGAVLLVYDATTERWRTV